MHLVFSEIFLIVINMVDVNCTELSFLLLLLPYKKFFNIKFPSKNNELVDNGWLALFALHKVEYCFELIFQFMFVYESAYELKFNIFWKLLNCVIDKLTYKLIQPFDELGSPISFQQLLIFKKPQ